MKMRKKTLDSLEFRRLYEIFINTITTNKLCYDREVFRY